MSPEGQKWIFFVWWVPWTVLWKIIDVICGFLCTHTFIYNYLIMFTVYEYVHVYIELGNHIYIYISRAWCIYIYVFIFIYTYIYTFHISLTYSDSTTSPYLLQLYLVKFIQLESWYQSVPVDPNFYARSDFPLVVLPRLLMQKTTKHGCEAMGFGRQQGWIQKLGCQNNKGVRVSHFCLGWVF